MAFDRCKYPSNWNHIRASILERAAHKCEKCGVSNRAVGYREKSGEFIELAPSKSEAGMEVEIASLDGHKVIEIVLTISHVFDEDPMNCELSNLAAWCQRCHLRHDIDLHVQNAAATRGRRRRAAAQKAGQMELIEL